MNPVSRGLYGKERAQKFWKWDKWKQQEVIWVIMTSTPSLGFTDFAEWKELEKHTARFYSSTKVIFAPANRAPSFGLQIFVFTTDYYYLSYAKYWCSAIEVLGFCNFSHSVALTRLCCFRIHRPFLEPFEWWDFVCFMGFFRGSTFYGCVHLPGCGERMQEEQEIRRSYVIIGYAPLNTRLHCPAANLISTEVIVVSERSLGFESMNKCQPVC